MRNRNLHIRLTESDYNKIREKSKLYPTITAFILDSVDKLDDEVGALKIDALNTWASEFKAFKADLDRIGNNINQIAQYINKINKIGGELPSGFNLEAIKEYNVLMKQMVDLQRKFTKKVIKI